MTKTRALLVVVALMACALGFLTVKVFTFGSSLTDLVQRVSHGLENQTSNRSHNVAVWCGAINTGRSYDRAFVARTTHGQVRYTLGLLPCAQLEKATTKSAQSSK